MLRAVCATAACYSAQQLTWQSKAHRLHRHKAGTQRERPIQMHSERHEAREAHIDRQVVMQTWLDRKGWLGWSGRAATG